MVRPRQLPNKAAKDSSARHGRDPYQLFWAYRPNPLSSGGAVQVDREAADRLLSGFLVPLNPPEWWSEFGGRKRPIQVSWLESGRTVDPPGDKVLGLG